MGRVEGKVALVAGAGGGIGGAGAEALAREGASVLCADLDGSAAETVAARIRAAGGTAAWIALDVRDRSSVDAAIARAVGEYGALDVMVDSAGVINVTSVLDLDPTEWERIIAINLTGMFHLGQAAARHMVRQGTGGSIVNVTSQLAEVAMPLRAAYCASKGGGRSLTQAMAIDLAPHGIRVNAVAPGPTLTGLTEARFSDETVARTMVDAIPLGRIGVPGDLVGAILFLSSDDALWVTGSTVTVDGGYVAR